MKKKQEQMWFVKSPEALFASKDIPQADSLPKIRQFAAAVNAGVASAEALKQALDLDSRHLAYYRRAAVVLGVLVELPGAQLAVGPQGMVVLATVEGSEQERAGFKAAIVGAKTLKPFASFFEGDDVDVAEISHRIGVIAGLAKATADRRAGTLSAWKRYILGPSKKGEIVVPDVAAKIAKDIETHNALVKQQYLEQLMISPPKRFEELIATLVEKMGYTDVDVCGGPADGGVDIRATKTDEWGHKHAVVIQAKRYKHRVPPSYIQQMAGVMKYAQCTDGLIITTSDFSPKAKQLAEHDHSLKLIDGNTLVDKLVEHEVGLKRGMYKQIELIPSTATKAKANAKKKP